MIRRSLSQAYAFIVMALLLMNSIITQGDTEEGSIIIEDIASPGNLIYETKATFHSETVISPQGFNFTLRLSRTVNGQANTSTYNLVGAKLVYGVEYTLTSIPESPDERPTRAGMRVTSSPRSTHEYSLEWLAEDGFSYINSEASFIRTSAPLVLYLLDDDSCTESKTLDLGSVITLLATRIHSTKEDLIGGANQAPPFSPKAAVYHRGKKTMFSHTSHMPVHLLDTRKTIEPVYLIPGNHQLEEATIQFVINPDTPGLIRSTPILFVDRPVFFQIEQTATNELKFGLLPFDQSSSLVQAAMMATKTNKGAFTTIYNIDLFERTQRKEGKQQKTTSRSTKLPYLFNTDSAFENMLKQLDITAVLNDLASQYQKKSHIGDAQDSPRYEDFVRATPEPIERWEDSGWISSSEYELHPGFTFPQASTQKVLLRYSRSQDRLHMPLAELSPGAPKALGAFFLSDGAWHIMDYRIVSFNEFTVTLYPFQPDPTKELAAELEQHLLNRVASGMLQADSQLNVNISQNAELTATLRCLGKEPSLKKTTIDNWASNSALVDPAILEGLPEQHEFVPALMAALEVMANPDQLDYMQLDTLVTSYKALKVSQPWFGETSQFLTAKPRNETLIPHRYGAMVRSIRKLGRAFSILSGLSCVHKYPRLSLAAFMIAGFAVVAHQQNCTHTNGLSVKSVSIQPSSNQTISIDSTSPLPSAPEILQEVTPTSISASRMPPLGIPTSSMPLSSSVIPIEPKLSTSPLPSAPEILQEVTPTSISASRMPPLGVPTSSMPLSSSVIPIEPKPSASPSSKETPRSKGKASLMSFSNDIPPRKPLGSSSYSGSPSLLQPTCSPSVIVDDEIAPSPEHYLGGSYDDGMKKHSQSR